MLYLAYGANTNRGAMAYRCPESVFVGIADLPGFELVFRGVADLRPAPARSVQVALWDITDTDLAALDRFEGYPRLYTRRKIPFTPLNLRQSIAGTRAWVYTMTPGPALAPPVPYYLDALVEGYRDCDLPGQQLATALALLPGRSSPNRGHVSRQWAL